LLDLSMKSINSSEDLTASNSSFVNDLAGKLVVAMCKDDFKGPSAASSLAALSSSSISLRRFCRSSSSLSRSLRLSRFLVFGVKTGDRSLTFSGSEGVGERPLRGDQSSVVCTPLLYEKTSLTGDGGNS
jgi:hypothetical protein